MPSHSSAPMFVGRHQQRVQEILLRVGRGNELILEQDRMPLLQPRGQQPVRRDHRQIEAVAHRDQLRFAASR